MAVNILSLPDECLELCLGGVPEKERLRSCCLVSRRFHHAAHAAPLLQSIRATLESRAQAPSFAAWLRRHGSKLTTLVLQCGSYMPNKIAAAARELPPELPLLFSTLASAATRVERLTLTFYNLAPAAALPLPSCLKQLRLWTNRDFANQVLALPGGFLDGLTQLEELHLSEVGTPSAEQLACMPRLSYLSLQGSREQPVVAWTKPRTAAAPAIHPPALRVLELGCASLPASPATLQHLEVLTVQDLKLDPTGPASANAAFAAVLPHLHGLTALLLGGALLVQPPVGLAQLSRLERLVLGISSACNLPAGPWQRSLRWLEASWPTLRSDSGLGFLCGCSQLQQLQIPGDWMQALPIPLAELATPAFRRFCSWVTEASCRGGLRRVTVGFNDMAHMDSDVVDPDTMQDEWGGFAHDVMQPGLVGNAYDERAALLCMLRSAASRRTSIKAGNHWMGSGREGEMWREVRRAHTAWSADLAHVSFFDEDMGEPSQGWAGSDSGGDGDSQDEGSSGEE